MSAPVKNIPAYAPYESLVSVIDQMGKTLVPQRLDIAEFMPKMSGGMRSHVLSGLKYLGLIDSGNHPTKELEDLVEARKKGGDDWSVAVQKMVLDRYGWAEDGFDLTRVTSKQLRERFEDKGGVSGAVADRSIRFYLKALADAKIEFAQHLKARKPRGSGPKRAKPSTNGDTNSSTTASASTTATPKNTTPPVTPNGMKSFPIWIKGKPDGFVTVPENITTDECAMLDLAIQMVKAYAAQNAAD